MRRHCKRLLLTAAIAALAACWMPHVVRAQNCQPYNNIYLEFYPMQKTVCVGETVSMFLYAYDMDYCSDPGICWDNIEFDGNWLGPPPSRCTPLTGGRRAGPAKAHSHMRI